MFGEWFGGWVAGCAANGKYRSCVGGGRRVGTYRLERGRHALVELVHLERPGLLLGYVILEANLRRSFGKRGGSAKAVEGPARRGFVKARAGRSWTNLILRDTTTSRGAHLVEGIVLVPVPDAALPRVPHRTLHLLPGEIVHGGLARREMNARCWSGLLRPPFLGDFLGDGR